MKTLIKALATLAIGATVSAAFAQRMNSDWRWDDVNRYRGDLHLSTNQGSRISAINRRAEMDIRRLNGMHVSGQERALRIRAIHDRARQDILVILNDRQRDTMRNRGFDVLMSPVQERHVYTLKRVKASSGKGHGKAKGHGG